MHTYQQVVFPNSFAIAQLLTLWQLCFLIIACLCNPISINTFVVFLRLYWFEKRFQHIVRDARSLRRTRTRSIGKGEHVVDLEQGNQGVGGREIKVLKETGAATKQNSADKEEMMSALPAGEDLDGSNSLAIVESDDTPSVTPSNGKIDPPAPTSPFQRDVVFADEVVRTSDISDPLPNEDRVPEQRPKEQHIAFVEKQRNPQDKAALRIPGPRDFERGYAPERVEDDDHPQGMLPRRASSLHSEAVDGDGTGDSHTRPRMLFAESSSKLRDRLNKFPRPQFGRNSSPKSLGTRARSSQSAAGRTFSQSKEDTDPLPYLSYTATIGRNSMFVDLTEEQREELGGIEYRALKTLSYVLLVYNFGFTIFGVITHLPWIMRSEKYKAVLQEDGQSPVLWGFYTAISSFTDLGFTVTPDSMISFNTAVLPLVVGAFLIVAGNTGFPCMLRFCIWIGSKLVPMGSGIWDEFRFLLDHPRRCFTLLFPRKATWWLFGILVLLNGIDLIFFIVLDLHDSVVTSLPGGFQFLDGMYQAVATRTAGFSVVNLSALHPAIQVSYLVMMYISVFPIAISVRQTNVYEEKSLGIYGSQAQQTADELERDGGTRSYLSSHMRRQLSFDLWYVFLGLFVICIVEGGRIQDSSQPGFTVFTILFEVVSAYGTVGLSLGYPNTNASFSAQFQPLSKLIIIAMMLRGRHRGLPYALDRAILLPGEGLKKDKVRDQEKAAAAIAVAEGILPGGDPHHTTVRRGRHRSRSRVGNQLRKVVTGALTAGPSSHLAHAGPHAPSSKEKNV
jgi:Trk-type K+ transport system membrane component